MDKAHQICAKAAELIGGERDRQHGAKERNFQNIADLWTAYLDIRACDRGSPITAHDVALMMVLTKVARTQTGGLNVDDYVDAAGYAGCAGELAISSQASPILGALKRNLPLREGSQE